MAQNITFPIIAKGLRRNAETGVEIVKSEPDNGDGTYYTVNVFGRDSADAIMSWSAPTLAEAREYAVGAVVAVRAMRAAAHEEARAAKAKADDLAYARKQFPSTFAILDEQERTDAAVAAATAPALDRVELVEFGTAEPSGYVYVLSPRVGHAVCLPRMPKMEIVRRGAQWAVRIEGEPIVSRCPTKRAARARLDAWLVDHLREINA